METGHLLVVDDEPEMLVNCRRLLNRHGHACTTLSDPTQFTRVFRDCNPDMVLCDLRMPGADGMQLLATTRSEDPDLPFVLITAYATVSSAVQAIQEGAFDYLAKPFTAQQLNATVQRALRQRRLAEENRELRDQVAREQGLGEILGTSPAIRRVIDRVRKVAGTGANVLISGESGTGKELVARCIHSASHRRASPFVAVDCSAIPETLLESSLFGHEKGAFTGATARQRGLLEQANQGTLFFDEITELDASLQSKLLRALQEREVRRIGSNSVIRLDIRVVAATNLNPVEATESGRLREDLYYRLNVIPIEVPPLRERGADVVLLLQRFLEHFSACYDQPPPKLSSAAWKALEEYSWPGNVRELKNIAERLVLLDEGQVTRANLPAALVGEVLDDESEVTSLADMPYKLAKARAIREFEGHYLEKILERHHGNVTKAAAAAGISRRTLHRWLQRLKSPTEAERA